MKGGGGGASSQRAMVLLGWIKAVLAIHSGHLMAVGITEFINDAELTEGNFQMPDLVARLSGLHATLTTRLVLQESLLSLSGRLDMVLSQIELRSSATPAPLAPQKVQHSAQHKRVVRKYVEGESEEEESKNMDIEVESGDDAGSIEDVELGGDDEEDSDEEDFDDASDSDDEDDDEGTTPNGFIDDEADEFDEDEDYESE
jgi:U3 small nucleolar RNA-associated protein 5